jgi:hypothetical protein
LQEMEASTSKDLPSFASTSPPTSTVRATSPPPVYVGDIPIITFENSLEDVIGKHNEAYFDSQEFLEEGRESSYEELEEEEIFEGEYAFHEDRTLEELWWPAEVLHNVHSLHSKKDSCGMRKRRKVLGELNINVEGGDFLEGEAYRSFPAAHCPPPTVSCGGGPLHAEPLHRGVGGGP